MSLAAFAKDECANWVGDGYCLGCALFQPARFRPEGRCWILDGKPCPYFKEILLPLAILRNRGEEILRLYSALDHNLLGGKTVKSRLCACGEPLPPRKRMCPDCARKSARTRAKNSMREKRGMLIVNGQNRVEGIKP